MSLQTDLIDALKANGIPAYLPGRAPGDCRTAHAVVTDGGTIQTGKTTGRRMYYITAYVPESRPGDLAALVRAIPTAVRPVTACRATGDVSEAAFDEEKGAHYAAVEFAALCSLI